MSTSPTTSHSASTAPRAGRLARLAWRFLFGLLLPLAVLAGAGVAAKHLIETGPKADRQPPPRQAKLVEVQPVQITQQPTTVHAMGTAIAARSVDVQPRVGGQIIEVSDELMPGGVFREGDPIVRLDPTDFELTVRQREADVAKARANLAVERGNQAVAQREYELLGEDMSDEERALVLREPQLATVEAALETTEAALAQAKLDLARTVVGAPFNAVVNSYDAELGEQVSAATKLAQLTGTDAYWIEVSAPVDELKWIRIPRSTDEAGSAVRMFNETAWGDDAYREGRVLRLADSLEEQGRMARLIVAVEDPLSLDPAHAGLPTLLIGSYVRVEIDGAQLEGVVALDRGLVRDNDHVWIMDGEGKLEIRPVQVAYRGRDKALISAGLAAGDRVVTTDLSAPVAGMPLRLEGQPEPGSSGQQPDRTHDGHPDGRGVGP